MGARRSEQWLAGYGAKRGLRLEIVDEAPKPNKYRAKRTEVDGIMFDSKREAARYQDLKVRERGGLINDLRLQVSYPLVVNGVKIAIYRSDFEYTEDGQRVVEDTKSDFTRKLLWYRMKKKLMLAIHGIEIRET